MRSRTGVVTAQQAQEASWQSGLSSIQGRAAAKDEGG